MTVKFTHVYATSRHEFVALEDITPHNEADVLRPPFYLIHDRDAVTLEHGRPSYRTGGWSYGHVQHGYLCAGAGGLNSMKVQPLRRPYTPF